MTLADANKHICIGEESLWSDRTECYFRMVFYGTCMVFMMLQAVICVI